LPPGEYRIAPLSLPFGYYIKEMSSGNVDLLRSPLIVTKGKPPEIQMTLSRTAPDSAPPRATVSGRVTGLPAGAGASPLALVLNEVPPDSVGTGQLPAVQHVGEASLTPDGEFQFREVPPGTYALFLFQQNEPFGDLPVRLTVNGQDLNGLEIRATVQGITLPPPELPEPRQPSAALLLPVTTGDDDVGLRIAVPEKWVFSNGAGFEADNRRLGATSYLVECKPIELNIGGIGTLGSECSRGHYLAHLSKQMLPGEIQLNISAGSSSGRVGDENMPADTVGLDLPSLLSAAALRPTGEPALASLRVSFAKRGFIWEILVYAKGAISEGDTKDLKAMLASLQFIDGPVSSEHWAAHLAWQQLPADERKPEVCWTIPHGMCGGRHVNVTKEESTYLVTFENRELPNNPTWKFRVEEAAGKVSRVP
jgi:hypothetical protein